MLRVTVCALLLHTTLGSVGHDDTAKRRSEEILRAVAAAATADYEGLQQMKAQKVHTKDQISNTMKTKECVYDLSKVLQKEENELEGSAIRAQEDQADHEAAYKQKEEELKRALHNALQDIYMSIHKRYEQIAEHTKAMVTALGNEINARASNQAHWDLKAGDKFNLPDDFNDWNQNTAGNHSLAAHGGDLLSLIEDKVISQSGENWQQADILDELKALLLSNAEEVAYNATMDESGAFDQAKHKFVRKELILLGSLIGDEKIKTDKEYYPDGSDGFPRAWVGTYKSLDHAKHEFFSDLEYSKVQAIQDQYVALINAKIGKKAATIKEGAYNAAKHKATSKRDIVKESVREVSEYLDALKELDADELKKIADIKEEFESLAADWWQLAIYHCCDIVQGNPAECDDAINHLKAPLDSVFPGALRKPDVKKGDCGRRLL